MSLRQNDRLTRAYAVRRMVWGERRMAYLNIESLQESTLNAMREAGLSPTEDQQRAIRDRLRTDAEAILATNATAANPQQPPTPTTQPSAPMQQAAPASPPAPTPSPRDPAPSHTPGQAVHPSVLAGTIGSVGTAAAITGVGSGALALTGSQLPGVAAATAGWTFPVIAGANLITAPVGAFAGWALGKQLKHLGWSDSSRAFLEKMGGSVGSLVGIAGSFLPPLAPFYGGAAVVGGAAGASYLAGNVHRWFWNTPKEYGGWYTIGAGMVSPLTLSIRALNYLHELAWNVPVAETIPQSLLRIVTGPLSVPVAAMRGIGVGIAGLWNVSGIGAAFSGLFRGFKNNYEPAHKESWALPRAAEFITSLPGRTFNTLVSRPIYSVFGDVDAKNQNVLTTITGFPRHVLGRIFSTGDAAK